MYTINFNKNHPLWNVITDIPVWLHFAQVFLQCDMRRKGHIYVSEIYEELGVCWNNEDTDVCLQYREGVTHQFRFEILRKENGETLITILLPEI